MPFSCPFLEKDGGQYRAGSREAFRRHLTIHHERDFRRNPWTGQDEIVELPPQELADRRASIKRSQSHKRPPGVRSCRVKYVPPPPCDESSASATATPMCQLTYVPPPPPMHDTVRFISAWPGMGDVAPPHSFGPPPMETAYSPFSDALWPDEMQDSRPDTPLDFANEPELRNPWAFLE